MSNDHCDLSVILDVCQDPFSNGRMLFHLTPFIRSECTRLFEKASGQANLSNVVNQATQVHQLLRMQRPTEFRRNVASVQRYGFRVARRISISGIERGDE